MVTSSLQTASSDKFESWGRFVARRPWSVLVISLILAVALMSGVMTMSSTSESVNLWAIKDRAYRDYEYMDECCGGTPSFMIVYAERVGPGSIFDRDAILELLKVHNFVAETLTVTLDDGTTLGYKDVCVKEPMETTCADLKPSASLLGVWDFNASLVPSTDAAVLAGVNALHAMYTVRAFAANVEVVNTSGVETVVSSRAFSLGFGVHNDAADQHKLFEAAFNDLDGGVGTIADSSVIKVTHFSNAALDAETGRTVARDIPLFVIALNLVVVFLGLTLGRTRRLGGVLPVPDLVGGRWLLAWTALMSVGLAAGTGFGLTGLLGGTFHSVVSLLPLIALGVQVDDCVITVNQLALVPSSMATASIADRFAHSLRESGPCITTTSLTTCVAFAVGISASLPGVSYFCMYATAVFFFGWFFQVTFFYACVVLDERRIVRRGCCALPCVTVGGGGAAADAGATSSAKGAEEGRQDGSAFQQAMSRFARLLLHPAAALCVAIAFSGAAGAAGALVHRIPVGLPLEDILPDDSYIREAFAVEEAVFNGRTAPITVVVKGADFELASARQAFRDAVSGVGALDFALAMPAHWMDAYEAWTAAQGTNFSTYLGGMAQFLTADGATKWQAHVQCADASCAALRSAKFTVLAHTSRPGQTVLDELSVRDDIDQVLGRSYAASETVTYALSFMFAETDQRTWAAVLSSIGLALAGVFVVMCLSTSPLIALWVSLCVAMIDAELLLVAYLWGMQLNSITYTCLVMACGLAVDYCVHIGHAFEHALHADPAIAPKEAAQTAIVRMGASVFQGGFTTFLGTLVIAAASSVAFRTFFRFIFATVLLGVAHGMVLLPVLLAYLTPRCLTSARSATGGGGGGKSTSASAAAATSSTAG